MTETKATYKVGAGPSLSDFKGLACTLKYSDPGYVAPSPEQVDTLIKAAGWSQSQAARIVGVTYNPKKGSTTIRKWRTPEGRAEHRPIPYAAWRLFLINAGVVVELADIEDHDYHHDKKSVADT